MKDLLTEVFISNQQKGRKWSSFRHTCLTLVTLALLTLLIMGTMYQAFCSSQALVDAAFELHLLKLSSRSQTAKQYLLIPQERGIIYAWGRWRLLETKHPFRKVLNHMPGVKCISTPSYEFSNKEKWTGSRTQILSPQHFASDILTYFCTLLVSYLSPGGSSSWGQTWQWRTASPAAPVWCLKLAPRNSPAGHKPLLLRTGTLYPYYWFYMVGIVL